jgi:hypothetical protein
MTNKCSRAGCTQAAQQLIIWRNPKIHAENRIKTWGACDQHEAFLVDYLSARSFFLRTEPVTDEIN